VLARLVAGRVRERHGDVLCLASCSVELLREDGRVVAAVPFTRDVFQAFAAARIVHLLGDAAAETVAGGRLDYAFALHGAEDGHEPVPVAMTALAPASVRAATAAARAVGTPAADWIVTVLAADVVEGLAELDRLSRASGVETAGRVRARLGFDAGSRTFVRLLDRLVVARDARATETAVVSTAASWGEFLAGVDDGPQAATSVHTHLHLSEKLRAAAPLISIDDLVTHYVVFPDPLSAALVVTLFPDRSVTRLYGYAPDGRLAAEPGFWIETRGEDAWRFAAR
jgi:hypothetical protein